MARVQWHGQNFIATPIEQYPNGDWLMESQAHGARISVGTKIRVKPTEIIEMAAAETPADPAQSAAALEQAMADERKTLPSVQELIATAKEAPAAPPSPAPESPDMSSKLSQLAALAADTNKEIEAKADASLTRLTAARAKAQDGLAKLDTITAEVEAGTAAIEDMANQLSNGGPTLGK